jgi:hypothetical protein
MKRMKHGTRIRLEIVALICAVVLVVISAAPIFNRGTDASLIGLIAGSFGAGLMLANILRGRSGTGRKG